MSDGPAVLAAILADPDGDAVRLVYADWLEEHAEAERAEFIRVQVEAERHPKGSLEHAGLVGRAVSLLTPNAGAWAGHDLCPICPPAVAYVHEASSGGDDGLFVELGSFLLVCFRRGFVDRIDMTPAECLSFDPRGLRPSGPFPMLNLQFYKQPEPRHPLADVLEHLVASPLLDRVGDVGIEGGFGSIDEAGLHALAAKPGLLARLMRLRLSEEGLGEGNLMRVLGSPSLTRLRDLAIDYNYCTPVIVDVMIRSGRFGRMTDLLLTAVLRGGHGLRPFGRPGLWPRLRRLILDDCDIDDLMLRGLMRPGAFPALELLDLAGNPVHPNGVHALLNSGSMPRLRTLGVGGTPITPAEAQQLRGEFGPRVEIWLPERRRVTPG